MLKRLSIFFFFSMMLFVASCAPKREEIRRPVVHEELTIGEIQEFAGREIRSMKAIAEIKIIRSGDPFDFVKASIVLQHPGRMHLRAYKLGMLVRDMIMKDQTLTVISGKKSQWMSDMTSELYNSVFWWEDIGNGVMTRLGDDIIILTGNRQVLLDKNNLQPRSQQIHTPNGNISLLYGAPRQFGSYNYPGTIKIFIGDFTFHVKIKKLILNPDINGSEFQAPSAKQS